MIEVCRADDNELCGYVVEVERRWLATTVFGGELGVCDALDDAVGTVLDDGLPALADHWLLRGPDDEDEQVVCIQQASPTEITLALDYYPLPGVPTMTVPVGEIRSGRWTLRRAS